MSRKFNKLSIGCLIAVAVLFFLPWYTTNVESEIFARETTITGLSISRYAQNIADSSFLDLIGGSFKRTLVRILLLILRYLYLLPILVLVGAVLLFFKVRLSRATAATALSLNLLLCLCLAVLPLADADLASIMRSLFVTTPSIYLILVASVVGLFALFAPVPGAEKSGKIPR